MIAKDIHWIAAPLTLFAMFLIAWGRAPKETRAVIGRLPGQSYLLAALDQLDMIISPRDAELDKHLRKIIGRYDPTTRQTLKTLVVTGTQAIQNWSVFSQDSLLDTRYRQPGPIREELREPIKRILADLGV
jgi:hypothetical protein